MTLPDSGRGLRWWVSANGDVLPSEGEKIHVWVGREALQKQTERLNGDRRLALGYPLYGSFWAFPRLVAPCEPLPHRELQMTSLVRKQTSLLTVRGKMLRNIAITVVLS